MGGLVAQLIAFPIGRFWARIVPRISIFGHSLNPGPFTIKEHVLVTIMAGVGAQSAYAVRSFLWFLPSARIIMCIRRI